MNTLTINPNFVSDPIKFYRTCEEIVGNNFLKV